MEEKLGKALECCSRWNCCACPMVSDVNCTKNLPAEAKQYIDDLEERIAIMQESMEALEKRCKELEALEQRCKALEEQEQPKTVKETLLCNNLPIAYKGYCPWCNSVITLMYGKFCDMCGKAVKWE